MSMSEDFRYTSARDRRDELVRVVEEQGYCSIAELAVIFGVSEMTIRRDVARLVATEGLRSVHGGVTSLSPTQLEGSLYRNRLITRGDIKWQIAGRAAQLVEPNSVIAIDAGTTGASLAAQLPRDSRLRVVTASLPVISELAEPSRAEVICLGGVLHAASLSFAGPSTLSAIANLQVNTFFLAASGLSQRGAYCATDFDAVTKRELIGVADRVVLIADSSKFSNSAMVKVCDWQAISSVIIDDDLHEENATALRRAGVEILRVLPASASASGDG